VIPPIDEILSRFRENVVSHFAGLAPHADDLLDAREANEELDVNWQRVNDTLEDRRHTLPADTQEIVETIRRETYLAAYRETENPDIAAYCSDDFDLFALAAATGIRDPWLEALYLMYERDGFAT